MTTTIINNSELQKKVGRFSREIEETAFTVINRGKPKMIILPYFEQSQDFIDDYLEAFEMSKNKKKLQKDFADSLKSGISGLKV